MRTLNLYASTREQGIRLNSKIGDAWRMGSSRKIQFVVLGVLAFLIQQPLFSQDLISNFENGFGSKIAFARNFGLDILSEAAPETTNDANFVFEGEGALTIQSDDDFSEGFIVGSVFDFVPKADVPWNLQFYFVLGSKRKRPYRSRYDWLYSIDHGKREYLGTIYSNAPYHRVSGSSCSLESFRTALIRGHRGF